MYVCMYDCLYVCLSVCLSVCLPTYLPIPINLSIYRDHDGDVSHSLFVYLWLNELFYGLEIVFWTITLSNAYEDNR